MSENNRTYSVHCNKAKLFIHTFIHTLNYTDISAEIQHCLDVCRAKVVATLKCISYIKYNINVGV